MSHPTIGEAAVIEGPSKSVDRVVSSWQLLGPGLSPFVDLTRGDADEHRSATRFQNHAEQHAPISSEAQGATYAPWEKISASLAQAVKVQVDELLGGLQEGIERQFGKHNENTRLAIVELGSQLRDMMGELREIKQHWVEKPLKSEILNIHNPEQEPDSRTQANVVSLEKSVRKRQEARALTWTSTKEPSELATALSEGERRKKKADMAVSHLADSQWELREMDKMERAHSWIEIAFWRKMQHKSMWHLLLEYISADRLVRAKPPDNVLVDIVNSNMFGFMSMACVVANTVLSAYAIEESTHAVLSDPPEQIWSGWDVIDRVFLGFFAIELLLRMLAFRTWFFVAPHEWAWNALDFCLVLLSLLTVTTEEYNFNFARSVRLFRTFRAFRLVRVAGFFAELRKLLYSVVACMTSLFWAVLFLGMIMFIFSIFIMSLVVADIDTIRQEPERLHAIKKEFDGFGQCISTLFVIVAGSDWLAAHEALSTLGFASAVLVPIFVCFVQVGVMNIVIGVFAEASQRCPEPDLVAQDKIEQVEKFVDDMKSIFKHSEFRMRGGELETLTLNEFQRLFHQSAMQAYLASHEVDVSHATLIFKLCDKSGEGKVDLKEFVLGLFRLKGFSTALDSKIICHALLALEERLDTLSNDITKIAKLEDDKFDILHTRADIGDVRDGTFV